MDAKSDVSSNHLHHGVLEYAPGHSVYANMKKLPAVVIFALLISPAAAAAQILHVTEDPEPKTERCQNIAAAFHADGDVVRVDYLGQWKTWESGRYAQNGGPNNGPCATEALVRTDPSGEVVWRLRPSDSDASGLTRRGQVDHLAAHPDGSTLMTFSQGSFETSRHSTVVQLNADGGLEWSFKTKQAPKFSQARAFVGDDGELFVEYSFTNYGYEGGRFQLPGGRVWKMGLNESKTIVGRINPDKGEVMWEREAGAVVSAKSGEVLARSVQRRSGEQVRTRHKFTRLTYGGERLSDGYTLWMAGEPMRSAVRFGDEVWMTNTVEFKQARKRTGRLRVFDLDGDELHKRTISHGALLAEPRGDAPMRVLSPTNCTRDVHDSVGCITDALDVLTLSSWDEEGTASRIRVPSHRIEYRAFQAASTPKGIWLSAKTFYDHDGGRRSVAPAVIKLYSADADRSTRKPAEPRVWRAVDKPKSAPAPISL